MRSVSAAVMAGEVHEIRRCVSSEFHLHSDASAACLASDLSLPKKLGVADADRDPPAVRLDLALVDGPCRQRYHTVCPQTGHELAAAVTLNRTQHFLDLPPIRSAELDLRVRLG